MQLRSVELNKPVYYCEKTRDKHHTWSTPQDTSMHSKEVRYLQRITDIV